MKGAREWKAGNRKGGGARRVSLHAEEARGSKGKKPISGLKGKNPSPETEGDNIGSSAED